MSERGTLPASESVDGIVEGLLVFAEAEGRQAPFYARLARIMAGEPDICRLLLEAPAGLRRPVLLLAAIHDALLRHPDADLARWFPTISGGATPAGDPTPALFHFIRTHRELLIGTLRSRMVQTNEVNRSVAWWIALDRLRRAGLERASLVELGCSAGLNLHLDRYGGTLEPGGGEPAITFGRAGSPVSLCSRLLGDHRPPAPLELPDLDDRVGLELDPVNPRDAADARWLAACVWPEQIERQQRLQAALVETSDASFTLVQGDALDHLPQALDATDAGSPAVVLMSWFITYLERSRRSQLLHRLAESGRVAALVSLEAPGAVPGVEAPPLPETAGPEDRHASLLTVTRFGADGPRHEVLARCHPHLAWVNLLGS